MFTFIFFVVVMIISILFAYQWDPTSMYANDTNVSGSDEYSSFNQQVFGKYPLKPGKSLADIKMTEEGRYSSSTQHDIIVTLKQCREFGKLPPNADMVVTDATANVGGSTLAFASQVKQVNSVEISKETFDILSHNVGLFDFDNIKLINDDYTKIYSNLTQDLIFVDPPWGGPEYKEKKKLSLFLGGKNPADGSADHPSGKNLSDFFAELAPHAKVVCAKVPFNFDKDEFEEIAKKHNLSFEYHEVHNIKGKVKWINVLCTSDTREE